MPWRRERQPTPVFWPGEFHGLYSSWGRKESDTTERLNWTESSQMVKIEGEKSFIIMKQKQHKCLLSLKRNMKGIKWKSFSHVQLFATPWTVAHQAPLSLEFSRQEYWSGLPCPAPGDLPNPGVEPRSLACQWILSCLSHQGSPRILEWVSYPFSRELPDPGIKPGSPALQVDSLPAELPGKPRDHTAPPKFGRKFNVRIIEASRVMLSALSQTITGSAQIFSLYPGWSLQG